jgi:hypothetical protein
VFEAGSTTADRATADRIVDFSFEAHDLIDLPAPTPRRR